MTINKPAKSPSQVLSKFIARCSRKSSIIWALILALYSYSKVAGYAKGYPTPVSRLAFEKLIDKTSGLDILVGPAVNVQTVAGYTVWATYMVMMLTGVIWGILLVTKNLRGNEESGRFDVILSSELDLKQLTRSVINGLSRSVILFYVVLAVALIMIGSLPSVALGAGPLLFFALTIVLGISLFMLVAAFCCQIMPSRHQASSLALIILGVCFAVKATADMTSSKWLLDVSPLGWFEKLSPLDVPHYLWLLPMVTLCLVMYLLTILLSSRRELGGGYVKSHSSRKPRLRLLASLPLISIRFNKGLIITWASILFCINLFYGLLTKTVVSLLNGSSYDKVLQHIASKSSDSTAAAYAAVIFLIDMLLSCLFAASCLSNIRKDEATKQDVNFLAQPISRVRFLVTKLVVQLSGLVIIGLVVGFGYWLGEVGVNSVIIGLPELLDAGLNALIPATIILAIGILLYGLLPRLSLVVIYAIIVFSMLLSLLASDLKVNHYLYDLSVFGHVKLAPSASPNWSSNLFLLIASLIVGIVGLYLYNHRDLITD